MSTINNLQALTRQLLTICETLCERLEAKLNSNVSARISHGFVLKATRTLKGVTILYDHGLPEQAQALVRILLELRLSFECFHSMLAEDDHSTCMRVTDSMMLEKIKQLRASDFVGLEIVPEAPSPEDWENEEKEIASRYSAEDLQRLKKYGFTGVSIEQRAKLTGHEELYNTVYRNFSRNVHSTDYVEQHMHQGVLEKELVGAYYESRDRISLDTALSAAGGIADVANQAYGCGLDSELEAISWKLEGFRSEWTKNRKGMEDCI